MEEEKAQANRGECCDVDISEGLSTLIAARLPSGGQPGMFEMSLTRQLASLPARYNGFNLEMQHKVRGSKLVLPPHAEVLSGNISGSYDDSTEVKSRACTSGC
jgi:hypothetical protein